MAPHADREGIRPGPNDGRQDRPGDANMDNSVPPPDEKMDQPADPLIAASRAYQLEMFEQSMRRNVIVAMDTGTGKTRIAILRIRAELERSPAPKLVWFLAPTVLLCGQQYKAIAAQIPSEQGELITGVSNLETWEESTWQTVLLNVRFVVSTPGVLLDALNHAFVRLDSIALLVFDEAHGCVKLNSGRRIMMDFYHPAKKQGRPRPAILGLTASPVIGRKIDGLEELETTLDAMCVTPTRYRDELIFHTRRSATFRHLCGSEDDPLPPPGPNLARLQQAASLANSANAGNPGAVLHELGLAAVPVPEAHKKWTTKYMNTFSRRAARILEELGPWGAEYYIHKVIRRIFKTVRARALTDYKEPYLMALLRFVDAQRPAWPSTGAEAAAPDEDANNDLFLAGLSKKVNVLAEILQGYHSHQGGAAAAAAEADQGRRTMTGIVFVRERPMAPVLARIMSLHPLVRERFRAGHVVGMSQACAGDMDECLMLTPKHPAQVLQRFRTRALNLLVATSVIEEGIDVPACNLVICVDELTNVKAFIQRRGRARETDSEFHLLQSQSPTASGSGSGSRRKLAQEWEDLEGLMKSQYEDELREAQHLQQMEAAGSDVSDALLPPLVVPSTGARVSARDAKQHLQHFCATTSSSSAFVDNRPIYRIVEYQEQEKEEGDLTSAFVQLPITLPAHLRRADSIYAWRRQDDAFVDAALQAYKMLYEAGLLTDHLLPPQRIADLNARHVEGRANKVAVHETFRPWPGISEQWKAHLLRGGDVYRHAMRIVGDHGAVLYEADLILPTALPCAPDPFRLYWTAQTGRAWRVHIGAAERVPGGSYDDSKDHACVLLETAYGHRWPITDAHRLVRVVCRDEVLTRQQVAVASMRPFAPQLFGGGGTSTPDMACLVRDREGVPYMYRGYLASKPPVQLVRKPPRDYDQMPEAAPYVAVQPWPKIVGHLHATVNVQLDDGEEVVVGVGADENDNDNDKAEEENENGNNSPPPKYRTVLPASTCSVDNLPMAYVQLGSLLPALNQVIEAHLVAGELMRATPLGALAVRDMSLVVTALSTPAARLPTNYERLEFIGDSILKVHAMANCSAQHLLAPEGHLSLFLAQRVANSRLSRAALAMGLDRFILVNKWSLKQWHRYCQKLAAAAVADDGDGDGDGTNSAESSPPPSMSTKMLADVVEALIGACHTDGGMPLALECIRLFLGDDDGNNVAWQSLEACRAVLFAAAPAAENMVGYAAPALEQLLGYTFTKPALLLEAMTHASYPAGAEASACMERLEFMGDAILDHVVVKHLAAVEPPLSHVRMHLLRTTLVNAAFLGFTAMTLTIAEARTAVVPPPAHNNKKMSWSSSNSAAKDPPPEVVVRTAQKALWTFMRHGASRDMAEAQQATARRFEALKEAILTALWTGDAYPWALLSRLHAEKFYSDLVEAVIGAIWVDSGSLDAVEALLEAAGVLPYLRRAVADNVHAAHPKEELGDLTGDALLEYVDAIVVDGAEADATTANTKTEDLDSDSDDEELLDDLQDAAADAAAVGGGGGAEKADVLYACELFINGESIVKITDGVSREDARTQAADYAVKAWKRGVIGRRRR